MGRSENRKLERRNRISTRKDKILLSKQELSRIKKEESDRVINFNADALLTCFALAEHKVYGYGKTRILRTLECVDDLMEDIINDTKTIDDYKKELEESVGLTIINER